MTALHPRPTAAERPDWAWEEVDVAAPRAWRKRAGDGPTRWRIRARHWAGPDEPRRAPVVVVHGLVVASGMTVPVAERLAEDGPVIAPDLPGCGRSDKPRPPLDVPELGEVVADVTADLLPGERPILVGVSLGSQVALAAVRARPDGFAGAVLVSPSVEAPRRKWRVQLARWQAESATQSWRLRLLQIRDYARAGIPRALRTFSAAMRHRPEDVITAVDLPLLVVHGGRDPLVRQEWARYLAHRAPRGQLSVVPRGVHAMTFENPVELARIVNGFADRLARGEVDR